ncbi:hypothetical protein D3C85_14940 [compost metagenome]
MIRKSDLIAIQQQVRAYGLEHSVVFSDETSLIHYGIVESSAVAHVDVSSSLFIKIANDTGNAVTTNKGRRSLVMNDKVVIHEGTNLGKVMIDGIYVYPIEHIQSRLKIRGDLRDLSLPKAAEPKKAEEAPVKQIPTWDNMTEAEADFEARCKRADWYYSYSDDIRCYRAGKSQCEALQSEAASHGGVYSEIYKYYSTR